MKWLRMITLASGFASFAIWQAFDMIFGDMKGAAKDATRTGIGVGVWTTITTALGMRSFNNLVRRLRGGNKEVNGRNDSITSGKTAIVKQKGKKTP